MMRDGCVCRFESKSVHNMSPFYTVAYFIDFSMDFCDAVAKTVNANLNMQRKMEYFFGSSGWFVDSPQSVFLGGVFNIFVKPNGSSIANEHDIRVAIRNLKEHLEYIDSSINKIMFPVQNGYDGFTADELACIFEEELDGIDVEVVFCNV